MSKRDNGEMSREFTDSSVLLPEMLTLESRGQLDLFYRLEDLLTMGLGIKRKRVPCFGCDLLAICQSAWILHSKSSNDPEVENCV